MFEKKVYKALLLMLEQGGKGALVTVLNVKGSTPQVPGAKMLIGEKGELYGTIGGGAIEKQIMDDVISLLKQGNKTPQIKQYNLDNDLGMKCNGEMDIFIEPVISNPNLFIFGAGHVAISLSKIASLSGFNIVIIDDRIEWANEENFPEANKIIVLSFENYLKEFNPHADDYAVIVTRGHQHDYQVLENIIQKNMKYIGMIGSKSKVAKSFDNLKNNGVKKELINRINSPIGLKIGSITPEEIAVSITAELIAIKRNVDSKVLSMSIS